MKNIFIICFSIFVLYWAISYFLLDGRFSYDTSFCSKNKLDSKKRNLFISDKLNIKVEGDSLKLLLKDVDVWSEKHCVITYYGLIFHKTTEITNSRKIMMSYKGKEKYNYCYNLICKKDTIVYSSAFPNNSFGVNVNDTLIYEVYNCVNEKGNNRLGKLYLQVK